MREDGCTGVPKSLCVRVCAKHGGDIHFSKAQQTCMPPSMFGLLLCIYGGVVNICSSVLIFCLLILVLATHYFSILQISNEE